MTPSRHVVLATHLAASFGGAALIFWIEPLITRMVLPPLGGSPAVWVTALVFFQACLLVGYLYAHALAGLERRIQLAIHLGFALVACLWLPPELPPLDPELVAQAPITSTLRALLSAVGAPFLFLASTAPLVQLWFSRTDHPDAADPYHLYAASNIGSLGALAAYPLLFEPMAGIVAQGRAWSVSVVFCAGLVLACGVLASRPAPAAAAGGGRWDWRWFALSAVPSSLLSGVTLQITTEIASAPLLWAIPLGLYLLTFILAFARWNPIPDRLAMIGSAALLAPILARPFGAQLPEPVVFGCELTVFFLASLVLHRELARARPAASDLTRFYLAMSVGGFLGGAFNALVAPLVFDTVLEFPIALALAMALRPSDPGGPRAAVWDVVVPVGAGAVGLGIAWSTTGSEAYVPLVQAVALGLGVVAALSAFRAVRLALVVATAWVVGALLPSTEQPLAIDRDFFGVTLVQDDPKNQAHLLRHGSTGHGSQRRTEQGRTEPVAYYWRKGPLGDVFSAHGDRIRTVAAVGLGTGAVACYAQPHHAWTFYEISPVVVRFATRPDLFSYLHDCAPDAKIVLGDARQQVARAPVSYDVIVLDAFSSDAIPAHLLTVEAFQIWLDHLEPGGVIALHISNRFMDLRPEVAAAAAAVGLVVRFRGANPPEDDPLKQPTDWVVMARNEVDLGTLGRHPDWKPIALEPGAEPWTDDHADLLAPVRRRFAAPPP